MIKMTVIIISLIILYLFSLLIIYLYQDKLIFQTEKLPTDFQFDFPIAFYEYTIKTTDNEELNCIHFQSKINAKGLIIYFHGNAGNLSRWGKCANDFTTLGYDVLMLEYRGYGKSTGSPGEETLYKDAELTWNWAKKYYKYPKWIIYGRSLGAAVATELAMKVKADLLVLETPFDDLNGALAAKILPFKLKYAFSNKLKLSKIETKKIIFHGTRDWIVPLSSAEKLRPLLGTSDKMVVIPKAGHRNLNEFKIYHTKLKEFLDN